MRHFDAHGDHSESTQSAESVLDTERNLSGRPNLNSSNPSFPPLPSGGQHSESNAACFSWPNSTQLHGAVAGRENYFGNLQKGVFLGNPKRSPTGQQATTLLDLMIIRALHSKILHRCSLGTAIGFRIRMGTLTDIPAILVFVARKVHRKWLRHNQCLPTVLKGPGGVWCDVDVMEFSYYGAQAETPKEQLYSELVDGLRGSDPCIGSCSQVASQETYGTLGAIVKSRTGSGQVGFLTNRHVAVDLDYPNQKMFHPLPPNLGPGVYLGAVERATSFTADNLWYGIYAGTNPDTFVRADGAFIPFAHDFDVSNVTTLVKGIGEIGDVKFIDLQSPINNLIGRQVAKVGRSSGFTTGTVLAYALEYNDEKGNCFFTDFLVVGENQQTFDLEGDSGSLIILSGEGGEKPRPIGIIWGGTANRGRLKLKVGQPSENWTSGVDLGRLLDLLELDLITTAAGLQGLYSPCGAPFLYFGFLLSNKSLKTPKILSSKEAVMKQRSAHSTVEESSPTEGGTRVEERNEEIYEPLGFNIQQLPLYGASGSGLDPQHDASVKAAENVEEHQFIPSFSSTSPVHCNQEDNTSHESRNLSALWDSAGEDFSFSLQLGDREPKRQRSDATLRIESPN